MAKCWMCEDCRWDLADVSRICIARVPHLPFFKTISSKKIPFVPCNVTGHFPRGRKVKKNFKAHNTFQSVTFSALSVALLEITSEKARPKRNKKKGSTKCTRAALTPHRLKGYTQCRDSSLVGNERAKHSKMREGQQQLWLSQRKKKNEEMVPQRRIKGVEVAVGMLWQLPAQCTCLRFFLHGVHQRAMVVRACFLSHGVSRVAEPAAAPFLLFFLSCLPSKTPRERSERPTVREMRGTLFRQFILFFRQPAVVVLFYVECN